MTEQKSRCVDLKQTLDGDLTTEHEILIEGKIRVIDCTSRGRSIFSSYQQILTKIQRYGAFFFFLLTVLYKYEGIP